MNFILVFLEGVSETGTSWQGWFFHHYLAVLSIWNITFKAVWITASVDTVMSLELSWEVRREAEGRA